MSSLARQQARALRALARRQTRANRPGRKKKSRPQLVLPGQLVFSDRVSLEHRFMLRPDRQMRELFFYLLGYFARMHGLRIHAVVLMSTHYHLLFTDVLGRRGDFFRDFHSMLTKAVQVYRGTESYVFDKSPTSQPECVTEQAGVEAMAYLITNPTEAGICEDPTKWPGLFTRVEDAGRRRVERFAKPAKLRREDGTYVSFLDAELWPDFVDLEQEPLCDALAVDPDVCVELVRREVAARIAVKREEQKTSGRGFVGVLHALHQRVTKQAASWWIPETLDGKIRPRVKAGRGQGPARARAIVRLFAFWDAHEDARKRILAGETDVVFPAGTFRWHRLFGFPRDEMQAGFFEMTSAFG
ncbi:MAG: hypothetical protein H6723_18850 [Sandaracinus sp.]|nr:hypothetical protein [Sandaracinus sp.]